MQREAFSQAEKTREENSRLESELRRLEVAYHRASEEAKHSKELAAHRAEQVAALQAELDEMREAMADQEYLGVLRTGWRQSAEEIRQVPRGDDLESTSSSFPYSFEPTDVNAAGRAGKRSRSSSLYEELTAALEEAEASVPTPPGALTRPWELRTPPASPRSPRSPSPRPSSPRPFSPRSPSPRPLSPRPLPPISCAPPLAEAHITATRNVPPAPAPQHRASTLSLLQLPTLPLPTLALVLVTCFGLVRFLLAIAGWPPCRCFCCQCTT
jgi:hypothetical protein